MTAASAPTLETDRLRLRAQALGDFEFYAQMWADPAVTMFIGGRPRPREEVWMKFLRNAGSWTMLGFGYWAVEEKTSGGLLGEAGIGEFEREMTPSIAGTPEAGWVFAQHAHGHGYATEAVGAIMAWSDENLEAEKTTCIIEPTHHASIRVAEKCGFQTETTTVYHGDDIVIMARPRGGNC